MPACPICQSTEVKLWSSAKDYEYCTSDKWYDYYQCNNCDCLFIYPVPVAELKSIYPPNYYSFVTGKKNIVVNIKEWMDKRYLKKILKQIKKPDINVLDVGGGTGWLSSLIKNIDNRVQITQIVDIDEGAKKLAEEKGHSYFQGTLEEFQSGEKYDLILLLNLIEHVEDPKALLEKTAQLVSDEGCILIKTPNTQSLDARWFRNSYWGGLHCPRHWIIFSEKSFRLLLQQLPLKLESFRYTQGAPFWAFSIIAALHRKKFITINKDRPIIFHPLFPFISAFAAAFDFLRSPFSKTSQLFIVLKPLKKKNAELYL